MPTKHFGIDSFSLSKASDLMANPLLLVVMGVLIGAIIAGVWGQMSIRRLQQDRLDYEAKTAQDIEAHAAELKNQVQQLQQQVEELKQRNAELEVQLSTVQAQRSGQQPTGIVPSTVPTGMTPWETELLHSFEGIMAQHIQSLEKGYDAQTQAKCSAQLLLDGKSTYTYAQVVKKFSSKYTRYDIRRSESILSPYVAELKIPFQEELKTGNTQQSCDAAQLKQLETPSHHEFGGYYGYWAIEYQYKDGQWVVNPSVIERNRDLYESAFQNGSPDYAKFRIDTDLFPEFK